MAPVILGLLLSVAAVYAVDRIERMTNGPEPADHNLLRVVFISGFLATGIISYALIAGTAHSFRGLVELPLLVAAILAALYAYKAHTLKTAAQLRRRLFDREVTQCSQALQRDPKNAAAHARLSELYEDGGDLDRALEHGRSLCELEPSEKNRRWVARLDKEKGQR